MNKENNKKISTGVSEIKALKMSAEEKKLVLSNIFNAAPSPNEKAKIPSPYLKISVFSFIAKSRSLAYALPAFLILVLGGGVVGASQNSLPGSIFYPVKVKIVEPMRGALIFSPEKKVDYEINLSSRRLKEAEKLVAEKRFDEKKEQELQSLLNTHAKSLDKSVSDLSKKEAWSEKTIKDVKDSYETERKVNIRMLMDFREKKNNHRQSEEENYRKPEKETENNGENLRDQENLLQ